MTCGPCDHAAAHGWFGPDHKGTHCSTCHRSWSSLKEAHCTICHQHFSADSVAALHEPYCGPDTHESMQEAVSEAGNPIFAQRDRANGSVWVRWSETRWEGTAA